VDEYVIVHEEYFLVEGHLVVEEYLVAADIVGEHGWEEKEVEQAWEVVVVVVAAVEEHSLLLSHAGGWVHEGGRGAEGLLS
jgi:hypothetical protein